VSLLTALGYTNVRHYPGGLAEWMESQTAPRTSQTAVRATHATPRLFASARFLDALADQTVGGLFLIWIEIVGVCGVLYWCLAWLPPHGLQTNGAPVRPDALGVLSAVYFSAVTATSVGYGDIVPLGAARLLAIGESIAGLVIFGCLISKFVSRRQEELIGEIHRIAFEERLGRVRTNLHLVRTEVQATSRLCEGQEVAPPMAVARVESIAMVFVGELRVVHDLLYRPRHTPDEPVLEAILASLASVFREFSELLRCVAGARADRSAALRTQVAAMSRLANEICGDCVPRQFAPALRTWMDQIQRISGDLQM
jgi:hypothetical protein